MKCVLCCVLSICFLLGLFGGSIYLMTLIDPGLLNLSEKAAAMIRADRGEPPLPTEPPSTLLPAADYMDAATLLKKMMPIHM